MWYDHDSESDRENKQVKMLWGINIHRGHIIEARKPVIVIVEKKLFVCWYRNTKGLLMKKNKKKLKNIGISGGK